MKRIMLLATVAALMSVMLVVGAASAAFAHTLPTGCLQTKDFWGEVSASSYGEEGEAADRNGNGIICVYEGHFGPRLTDDHNHNADTLPTGPPTGCLQTKDFWGEVSASNYSGGSFLDVDRNGNDILCIYEGHFGPRITDDHVHN